MSAEGHFCWESCDEGPHGCVCGNDCSPSIRDYTPTTEQVEFAYANDSEDEYRDPIGYPALVRQNKVAFRRWLAAHDAAIAHAAWSEGHNQALVNVAWPDERKSNPYTNNESEGKA